ncbi:putative Ig domain-containing protein [Enterovibrio norvegicus]|uniref:putative Ig domain-containing protein n=1 Tax=Enterovibrio norvegicus TaxID=188144 RepID=UPI001A7E0CC6|nr:putative Ig domain-containing protein [Enterovibrio norvegicus]
MISQDYEVIADSYVRNGAYANSNYGDYNYIVVKNDGTGGYRRKGFYRFQSIDVLDTGLEQVVEFRTSLKSGSSTSQTFYLYPTTDNTWTESGITWSNSPALGPLLGSNTIPGQTLNIDISQHVIDNPGEALSFRLQSTSNSYFQFVSREYIPDWGKRSMLRATRNYGDVSINENEAANIVLSDQVFHDLDGDTLTLSLTGLPAGLAFSGSTITGNTLVVGDHTITVTATDPSGAQVSTSFTLTVTDVNLVPTISGTPDTTLAEGSTYSFTPTANDLDSSDTLIFSVSNAPSWSSFNTATGELSGTPLDADVGTTNNIVITVTDDGAGTLSASLPAFNLSVTDINNAPTISGSPSTTISEGSAYSFIPAANDIDASDTLTFSVTGAPSWLNINATTGELSGTPNDIDVGTTNNIVVTVTDDGAGTLNASLPAFNLTVTNINNAPTISGTPATTVAEGSAYSFTPASSDVDSSDTLTFTVLNKPSWLNINSATGELSGTPADEDVGIHSGIEITVTDDGAGTISASLPAFNITVTDINNAPVISGTPATSVAEGSIYSFTPTASDADSSNTLTFTVANSPSWLSIDSVTGELSGTPADADVATYTGIAVTATDNGTGALSATLPIFSITVTDINNAPVISGTPATSVNEGNSYTFTPTASDIDAADTLTFSITNKPTWATFDSVTGTLSGTVTNADVGTTSGIQISVTDDGLGLFNATLPAFSISVVDVNNAPTISGSPLTTVAEGSSYSFTPTTTDLDGDTLTFSIVNQPAWANFNAATGELSGTPLNAHVGTVNGIQITVTDSGAGSLSAALPAFDLTVTDVNNPPTITGIPTTSVNEGSAYSFTPSANDLDGDTLTFSLTNKPDWLTFDTSTGTLSGTPAHADVGTITGLQLSVKDNGDGELSAALATFNITVVDINNAPTIAGTPSTTAAEGSQYSFTPFANDLDSDTLTFSIVNLPSWASFNTATGELSGTPGNADVGTTTAIAITVTDDGAGTLSTSLAAFDLAVSDINNPPIITGTPTTSVNEGDNYSFTPSASDLDGDTLTFSITNKPDWLSFDPAAGVISGTPTHSDVGIAASLQISVKDNGSGELSAALPTFNITVVDINNAPTIAGTPPTSVDEGSTYSFTPVTADLDSDTLTFSIVNQPGWASFNAATGELSGIPGNGDVGTTSGIVITVTDDGSGTLSATLSAFDLTVSDINNPPTITGTPATSVNEGDSYSFTPMASDLDGDSLIFSIINKPEWLSFDTNTGALTGTPADSHVGLATGIQISVKDNGAGELSSSLATFNINVVDINNAPALSGTPATTVEEGSLYRFTPVNADLDGDTLTFSITNKPSWASFDTATGELSGTPADADVGTTSGILISVIDDGAGTLSATLPSFNITVSDINNPPTISGTPVTSVNEGGSYSFIPAVADLDGDTLTFSVINKPNWLTLNTSTGELSGTPLDADVGISAGIQIVVTDDGVGSLSAQLAPFSLTVVDTNTTPILSGTPTTSVNEGTLYSFIPTATDGDTDTLTFSIVNQPSWLTFDSATGELSGAPLHADVGTTSGITITVTDDGIGTLSATLTPFSITVNDINNPPVITGVPAISIAEGNSYSFTPSASDLDGDTLTFNITNSPGWMSFDTVSGTLTGTPLNADVGTYANIQITVKDSGTGALSDSLPAFTLTVTDVNNAPKIMGNPANTVDEGTNYTFTPTIDELDGDNVIFSIINQPVWMTFDTVTGQLSGTPAHADAGTYTNIQITVRETTPQGLSDTLPAFDITVVDVNNAPSIGGTPATQVNEGSLYAFSPSASDLDGDTLTFTINNKPVWASFNSATGALSGTPQNGDVGVTTGIEILVTDNGAGNLSQALPLFNITVNDINNPPVINYSTLNGNGTASLPFTTLLGARQVSTDGIYHFNLNGETFSSYVDTQGYVLVAIDFGNGSGNLPRSTSLDTAARGLLSAPVLAALSEATEVRVSSSDNTLDAVTLDQSMLDKLLAGATLHAGIDDNVANDTWTGASADALTVDATCMSSNGNLLEANVFDVCGANSGAQWILGTSYTQRIRQNAGDIADNEYLALWVRMDNTLVVNEGDLFSFTPAASDLDADGLTFSVTNSPSWASFDAATGQLSGTPVHTDVGTSANITITVTDDGTGSLSDTLMAFSVQVMDVNNAPVISGTPTTTVNEGHAFSFTPTASDDDGDTLTYSIANQPSWVTFDPNTGNLSGTPDNADVGVTTGIQITLTDDGEGLLTDTLSAFNLTVVDINNAPSIAGTPVTTIDEGGLYSFTPTTADADSDSLTFSITNQPSWLNFDTTTGALTGSPAHADVGTVNAIEITVTDDGVGALSATLSTFNITVNDINNAPVISGAPLTSVLEGVSYTFTPSASDLDSDNLSFSILNQPAWANFDPTTGQLSGVPRHQDVGITTGIQITVTDNGAGALSSTLMPFSITVIDVNNTPTIAGTPPSSVLEGNSYYFTPAVSDADGDALSFSVTNKPAWATFNAATGELSGTPLHADVGTTSGIQIVVTDNGVGSLSATLVAFDLTVIDVNNPPVIGGTPMTTVNEGSPYTFTPTVSDLDGDTLIFSDTNKPSWLNFDASTGTLSGTPAHQDVGTSAGIQLTVTDDGTGTLSSTLTTFTITVIDINNVPMISGTPGTSVLESNAYTFTPSTSDLDGDTLSFSISNKPAWATFNTTTGSLTGTPVHADTGTTSGITITVTDNYNGESFAVLAPFDLTVIDINNSPTITGTPSTVVDEGNSYYFAPTASDPDSDTLTFSIINKPAWATFEAATGALYGIPMHADVGINTGIQIIVTDNGVGTLSASLVSFNITVNDVNNAPSISGSPPPTVSEGNDYNFTPISSDLDSDVLTFSVVNLPSWASFDTATGRLFGSPSQTDAGLYGGIIISVSDGLLSNSLSSFDVNVKGVNTPPVANNMAITLNEDIAAIFNADVVDADNDVLTLQVTEGPTQGTISVSGREFTYQPNAEYFGSDTFRYVVTDGEIVSDAATVSLTITAVNDPPVANDDVLVVSRSLAGVYVLDVLVNDIDVEDGTPELINVSVNEGTVIIVDGKITLTTNASNGAEITVDYLVVDSEGDQDSAMALVTVTGEVAGEPTIATPAPVTLQSTGLFTFANLGFSTATDEFGNRLQVELIGSPYFKPGNNKAYWQATDYKNRTVIGTQDVTVFPIISLGANIEAAEGNTIELTAYLNGDSPAYPVIVPFTVTGTADSSDHTLESGDIIIESGHSGSITFELIEDGTSEATEQIDIQLSDTLNLVDDGYLSVFIIDDNLPPSVDTVVEQSGQARNLILSTGAPATIRAVATDANQGDTLSYSWTNNNSEFSNQSISDEEFVFSPLSVPPGVYRIDVTVTDDAVTQGSVSRIILFEVVDILPTLGPEDSDGDLIPDSAEGLTDSDGDGIPDYLDPISDCNVIQEVIQTNPQYLVETEPGTCIQKGIVAMQAQSGGLKIEATEVIPDTAVTNIGGLFDFITSGMESEGDSIAIVVPQVSPIPGNAVYRKLVNGSWTTFVEGPDDAISSSQGAEGFCPAVNSTLWQSGLNVGHWCVKLTIKDGGMNDEDGIENKSVQDPGGVGIPVSGNNSPIAYDDDIALPEGSSHSIDVLANDTDPDNDSLSLIAATASLGTVSIISNQLYFEGPENYFGTITLTYIIEDTFGATDFGRVNLTQFINNAPTLIDDEVSMDGTASITANVLSNDFDADGDPITLLNSSAENGSVSVSDAGDITYTPNAGFVGVDRVTYSARDDKQAASQATLFVTVTEDCGCSGGAVSPIHLLMLLTLTAIIRRRVMVVRS